MVRVVYSIVLLSIILTISAYGQTTVETSTQQIKLLQPPIPTQSASNPAVPRRLSYQGLLSSSPGMPVADGSYGFTIGLFDVSSGGVPAWSDTFTLQVAQGTFSAILGSGAPLDVVFDKSYFIQVTVTSGPAGPSYPIMLLPRAELTSAPYALGPWTPNDSSIYFKGGHVGIGKPSLLDPFLMYTTGERGAMFLNETVMNSATALSSFCVGTGNGNYTALFGSAGGAQTNTGLNAQANGGTTTSNFAVTAHASGLAGSKNYGVYGSSSGLGATNYGVYGTATTGDTNWAGYFIGDVYAGGDVFVGPMGIPQFGPDGSNFFVANTSGDSKNSFRLDGYNNSLFIVARSGPGALVGTGINFSTAPAHSGESIRMSITEAGNVGIGILSPANKLSVSGSADFFGNVGIGTTSPSNKLSVFGGADFSGNVGIGTPTPGKRLTVAGSVEIGTTAGDYQHLRIGGGNSSGYLYGDFAKYQDVISIGYNYYTNGSGGNVIPNAGGGTSRISTGFGSIGMYTGGVNTEPNILGIFIDGFGRVGVGTSSPGQKLAVAGNICYTGSIGGCSDIRYKKNIISLSSSLEKISLLRGVSYHWRTDEFPEQNFSSEKQIGMIAQEVETVYPEIVITDAKGYKSIDYGHLAPALVEAIRELKAKVEETQKLREENHSLAARLAVLEAAVQSLLAGAPTTNEKSIGERK